MEDTEALLPVCGAKTRLDYCCLWVTQCWPFAHLPPSSSGVVAVTHPQMSSVSLRVGKTLPRHLTIHSLICKLHSGQADPNIWLCLLFWEATGLGPSFLSVVPGPAAAMPPGNLLETLRNPEGRAQDCILMLLRPIGMSNPPGVSLKLHLCPRFSIAVLLGQTSSRVSDEAA